MEEIKIGEQFDEWVEELIDEGYDLSKYTWEGLFEEYMKENVRYFRRAGGPSKEWDEGGYGSGRSKSSNIDAIAAANRAKAEAGARRIAQQTGRGNTPAGGVSANTSSSASRDRLRAGNKVPTKGGKPMFEDVVEYLYCEGYANTRWAARVMAENMSPTWLNEILEDI